MNFRLSMIPETQAESMIKFKGFANLENALTTAANSTICGDPFIVSVLVSVISCYWILPHYYPFVSLS